jgi:catechol 2,3-dioxygenase-like lactoylglutathione lyase family enzyme
MYAVEKRRPMTQTSGPAVTSVSGVSHIALMSGDIDRLAAFYETVFGAELVARSEGVPRKCFLRLTPLTHLHVFEVDPERARNPGDAPFDAGSINHFALEAQDVDAFVRVRDRLIAAGRSDGTVYEAPGQYTLFATDPDGLFVEWVVRKADGWSPPFPTAPFVGLGQSTPRDAGR